MISLFVPPGWTLHAGGPHIALALLKGYLEAHGVEAETCDLNTGSAVYHKTRITEAEVVASCRRSSADDMNATYFGAEDRLGTIAARYDGTWFAHEGFQRRGCDLGNPEHVREYSREASPFTAYFLENVIPDIIQRDPKIVGLSIYVPSQLLPTFEFVRLLRQSGYRGFIVLGGNHITRIATDMRLPWVFDLVDGIVTYQGERTLKDLYLCLRESGRLETVANLTWRDSDGVIRTNQTSLLKVPEFAIPDFGDTELDTYWGTPYLPMIGARGCFYGKCSFCAIPFGYGPKNYIGMSPARAVVDAMNSAYRRTGMTRFKFVDEALHPKMLRDMDSLRSEYDADFQFEGYVRFDSNWSSPKFLDLCNRIGLCKAYLGLELAPSESRSVLTKSDKADPLTVLRRMKDLGIRTHIFCLFGFPGTGIEEAVSTVEFTLEHQDLIDTLDIFPFYYARHTKVEGIEAIDEPERTWRSEHRYRATAEGVLGPEDVNALAESLSDIVWAERPEWSHPIYRMFSPWRSLDAARGVSADSAATSDACRPSQTAS